MNLPKTLNIGDFRVGKKYNAKIINGNECIDAEFVVLATELGEHEDSLFVFVDELTSNGSRILKKLLDRKYSFKDYVDGKYYNEMSPDDADNAEAGIVDYYIKNGKLETSMGFEIKITESTTKIQEVVDLWNIKYVTKNFGDYNEMVISVPKGTHPLKIRTIAKHKTGLAVKILGYNKLRKAQ